MISYEELLKRFIDTINNEINAQTPLETIYAALSTSSLCVEEALFNKLKLVREMITPSIPVPAQSMPKEADVVHE